VIVKFSPF